MQKPSKATIEKHLKKLMTLVRRNKGKLPSYTWLNEHGFFRSYELLRQFPRHFKGVKRAYAKR